MNVGGNGFDQELSWGPTGYTASGPCDWQTCVQITVIVTQGSTTATASGTFDAGEVVMEPRGDSGRGWRLTKPLEVTSGSGLREGRAAAGAVAVMQNGTPPNVTTQAVGWEAPDFFTLAPQP